MMTIKFITIVLLATINVVAFFKLEHIELKSLYICIASYILLLGVLYGI